MLLDWLAASALSVAINESTWIFPVVEALHLCGVALFGGAVLVVDLRLMNLGLKQIDTQELATSLRPWTIGTGVLLFASGVVLFVAEPWRMYMSTAFRFKFLILIIWIFYAFTLRRKTIDQETALNKVLAGLCSMFMLLLITFAGRWIGFS